MFYMVTVFETLSFVIHGTQLQSSLYLLRGKVHEAMDNRSPAIEDYKTALKLDVYCNEAFELLVRHEMLTPDEGDAVSLQ